MHSNNARMRFLKGKTPEGERGDDPFPTTPEWEYDRNSCLCLHIVPRHSITHQESRRRDNAKRSAKVAGEYWAHLKEGASRALTGCPPAVAAVLQCLATTVIATFSGRLGQLLRGLREEGTPMDAPSWLGLARVLRPLDCIQQLARRYPSTLGQLVRRHGRAWW
eukprot:TRINITY_DN128_c0_g2_i6.p2 TRINITY_DN128_c0_g2~~TRINITY_DN128_c0_g2_i6.p2  ORF type:complete len:164 (+),score=0.87 TRINITY_DN128_c0_g2_i6:817-1308(+)